MGNKTFRIHTIPGGGDKFIPLKLDQTVDFFEILSLKISQKDLYATFNSDFGVVVGRVIANGGIGIPNAKISVFIPITEDDKLRPEILAIYPYTTPRDKNVNGTRYNLLPRVSISNPFIAEGQYSPPVPVGTLPTKEELNTNETFVEVYEKYYKFTTTSNQAGDYMLFGVPVGTQIIHMSVDITDIGRFSMTPGTMVTQLGYSENLFANNKVKPSPDLETLPNVETQDISVDVRPFWGDEENFEVGITRQDFKIRATLVASVTVFGAGFTDAQYAAWGRTNYYADWDDSASAMSQNEGLGTNVLDTVKFNTSIASRRNGDFNIEVYGLKPSIPSSSLSPLQYDILSGDFDTQNDLVLLEKSQYSEILQDGMFILTLPCNRTKKVVDEFGNLVDTDDNDPNGIFTEFVGSFIVEYGKDDLSLFNTPDGKSRKERNRNDRGRFKIPQVAAFNESFTTERNNIGSLANFDIGTTPVATRQEWNEEWRRQVYKFQSGSVYSISKYNGIMFMENEGSYRKYNTWATDPGHDNNNVWRQAGSLANLNNVGENDTLGFEYDGSDFQFPWNVTSRYNKTGGGGNELINNVQGFGAEWLNFCFYFPQIWNYTQDTFDVVPLLTTDYGTGSDMTIENNYRVIGFRRDTSYFMRSDINPTTFVKVPPEDLVKIIQLIPNKLGFRSSDVEFDGNPLTGTYMGTGGTKYFYRGLATDVVQFLIDNGIISA